MGNRWVLLFVLMQTAGFSAAVTAQTLEQKWCFAPGPGDDRISGCTAMIQSGRETPPNLAEAFKDRGNAYFGNGQYDRAIDDYDQAIRLNPNFAAAFYDRGLAHVHNGRPDRAIEDFGRATMLAFIGYVLWAFVSYGTTAVTLYFALWLIVFSVACVVGARRRKKIMTDIEADTEHRLNEARARTGAPWVGWL